VPHSRGIIATTIARATLALSSKCLAPSDKSGGGAQATKGHWSVDPALRRAMHMNWSDPEARIALIERILMAVTCAALAGALLVTMFL
jgi:hypothetical protein